MKAGARFVWATSDGLKVAVAGAKKACCGEDLIKGAETYPEGKAPKAKHARNLRALWSEIFEKEGKKAAKAFRDLHLERFAKSPGAVTVDLNVDFSDYEGDVAEALAEPASGGGDVGVRDLFSDMGEPASAEIRTAIFESAHDRARKWAAVHAADLVSEVEETTRDMIRKVISDGLDANLSIDDIADQIEESTAFSDERAQLIAKTEVSNANSAGALEGYRAAKDNGLRVLKGWLNGSNPCPVCLENAAAGFIATEEEFPSGDMAPAAHPHCQCALTAKAEEDSE
jgi:hypothetical protein